MHKIKTKLQELHGRIKNYVKESLSQKDLEEDGLQGICLRGYQLEGVKWMKQCFENGHGCILGDEMGLGKTVQVRKLNAVVCTCLVAVYTNYSPIYTQPQIPYTSMYMYMLWFKFIFGLKF